jgi:hypothetical protein
MGSKLVLFMLHTERPFSNIICIWMQHHESNSQNLICKMFQISHYGQQQKGTQS